MEPLTHFSLVRVLIDLSFLQYILQNLLPVHLVLLRLSLFEKLQRRKLVVFALMRTRVALLVVDGLHLTVSAVEWE